MQQLDLYVNRLHRRMEPVRTRDERWARSRPFVARAVRRNVGLGSGRSGRTKLVDDFDPPHNLRVECR